ncbi:SDR family NAD(P)-dependent oxidoreductase [Chitinophaga sp.]|uniref:SDR family NAD(P)-dependent oxidoreductase n=1 Tax=Chitinophaga sp. TaxID=1869181 RepID=UPI0031E277FC
MKTIFITGASSGLGSACVKVFSDKGWRVIATMRNPAAGAALAQLPNVQVMQLDVNNLHQLQTVVKEVMAKYPADVVLNNAGHILMGPLEGFTDEQVILQITTNLLGPIRITQAFLPYFRERSSGLFLNVTSTGALLPEPFMALYGATKAAVETWSTAMRSELSKVGVRIKTLIPDLMQTSFVSNAQLILHPAYQQWVDKMLALFSNPDSPLVYDDPADVATFVYNATVDDSDQLHYLIGNNAIRVGATIEKEGVENILNYKEKFYFSA